MDCRKEYMKQYWHKNKATLTIRNRVRYILNRDYLLMYKRAMGKKYGLEPKLGQYATHKYWEHIQKENILGRYINLNKVFTKEEKEYINKLNYDNIL